MLPADHRPANRDAAETGQQQHVHERLAIGRHVRRTDPLAQLHPCQRTVGLERPLDHGNAALGRGLRDTLLRQPPGVAGEERRRRQRLQPRIVLTADEMQRAAVQCRDQQRAVLGQRPVDIGGGQADRPRPDRQPRPARILRLDREQALRHSDRIACRGTRQELSGQPFGDHRRGTFHLGLRDAPPSRPSTRPADRRGACARAPSRARGRTATSPFRRRSRRAPRAARSAVR